MKSFTQRWREASDEAEDQPMEDTPTDPKEAPAINTHVRLFDLVRHQRSALLHAELITEEEYGFLCAGPMAMSSKGGSPSRQRLEDYDELRAALTAQTERAEKAEAERDRARGYHHHLCQEHLGTGRCSCWIVSVGAKHAGEYDTEVLRLTAELDTYKETCGGMTAKQRFDQQMEIREELLRAGHNFGLASTSHYAKAIVDELLTNRAELDAVRKELSELNTAVISTSCAAHRPQSFNGVGCVECERLHEQTRTKTAEHERDAAQAKCAELEKLIQDAPHDKYCNASIPWAKSHACTCWKSRLTPTQQASVWTTDMDVAPKDREIFLWGQYAQYLQHAPGQYVGEWQPTGWHVQGRPFRPTKWREIPVPPEEKRP